MIQVLTMHRTCPAEIQARITRTGGTNRYGEPNFRIVWGWDRLTWTGGKWEDWERDSNGQPVWLRRVWYGYTQLPKYDPYFCWYLEKWMPPEHYGSPEYWSQKYAELQDNGQRYLTLGPYPARGEYEMCYPIRNVRTLEPLELTSSIVDVIVRMIRASRVIQASEPWRNVEAIRDRMRRKEQAREAMATDIIDDAAPAFGMRPTVFQAGV